MLALHLMTFQVTSESQTNFLVIIFRCRRLSDISHLKCYSHCGLVNVRLSVTRMSVNNLCFIFAFLVVICA